MMDDATQTLVRERAGNRCKYCQLRQDDYEFQTFHIEHIIAKQWDGTTLVGKTKAGIVTVHVLDMNNASRIMLRKNLLFEGRFPPCQ
jgi:hypothetical protein